MLHNVPVLNHSVLKPAKLTCARWSPCAVTYGSWNFPAEMAVGIDELTFLLWIWFLMLVSDVGFSRQRVLTARATTFGTTI